MPHGIEISRLTKEHEKTREGKLTGLSQNDTSWVHAGTVIAGEVSIRDNAQFMGPDAMSTGADEYTGDVGVESERDLARLRGSKYAQSDTGKTYRDAKAALESGRHVLYCGCPCQVAGLKAFLGKDYGNLLTVDLICGGNPSAYGLREYLDKTWGLGNVRLVRFRNMAGWDFRFEVFLRSGEIAMDPSNAYMKMYLKHALNKPSCDTCQFGRLPRQGDFTIGDFWNIGSLAAELDDGKGTSVVLLSNAKARDRIVRS